MFRKSLTKTEANDVPKRNYPGRPIPASNGRFPGPSEACDSEDLWCATNTERTGGPSNTGISPPTLFTNPLLRSQAREIDREKHGVSILSEVEFVQRCHGRDHDAHRDTVTAVVDVGMPPREEARRRGNATCTSLVRLSMFVSSPGALAAVIHVVVRQFHRLDVTDSPIFGSIWMPSGRSLALAEQAKVRASLLLQSMMVLTELH